MSIQAHDQKQQRRVDRRGGDDPERMMREQSGRRHDMPINIKWRQQDSPDLRFTETKRQWQITGLSRLAEHRRQRRDDRYGDADQHELSPARVSGLADRLADEHDGHAEQLQKLQCEKKSDPARDERLRVAQKDHREDRRRQQRRERAAHELVAE
jgi:hypothetical protein